MRKGNIRSKIPTFAFVVDGETEIWYLQMFKKNEQSDRNIRINIKPEIPQRKKLRDQYDLVVEQAKGEYDKVFWIVDLDVILKETRESKSEVKPIDKFIDMLNTFDSPKNNRERKIYGKVNVIVNNPCLEYWFLLHFENDGKTYNSCSEVLISLREHLKGYGKSERYFKKKDNDIYTRLKPHLSTGIKNAKELGAFDRVAPKKRMCEMDDLFLCDELKQYFEF